MFQLHRSLRVAVSCTLEDSLFFGMCSHPLLHAAHGHVPGNALPAGYSDSCSLPGTVGKSVRFNDLEGSGFRWAASLKPSALNPKP